MSTIEVFLPPCGVVKEMGLLLGPFPLRLKTLTVRLYSENGFSPGTMVWLLFPEMVRDCLSEGILLEVNRLWVCHQCTWEQEMEERERGCWWGDIYIYGKETKSENRGREKKKAIRKHTVEFIKWYKQLVCCWMTHLLLSRTTGPLNWRGWELTVYPPRWPLKVDWGTGDQLTLSSVEFNTSTDMSSGATKGTGKGNRMQIGLRINFPKWCKRVTAHKYKHTQPFPQATKAAKENNEL